MNPIPPLEDHARHQIVTPQNAKGARTGAQKHAGNPARDPSPDAGIIPEQHVADPHYWIAAFTLTIFAHGDVTSICN